MGISVFIDQVLELLMGWPLIMYVIAISALCTVAFKCIQITNFFTSIKNTFTPSISQEKSTDADMTPFQAFMNSLNSAIGNGSIGGVAVAIAVGGPGAVFWIVIVGLLLMAMRFAEIYLTTYFGPKKMGGAILGGPMVYLHHVIGGRYLAYIYALFCVFFGFIGGSAIQTNTIGLSVSTTWGIPAWINAVMLTVFVAYIVLGGASRIIQASMRIVPVKVVVFFVSSLTILAYHHQSLVSALQLIVKSAFSPVAVAGGLMGFTIQQAMRAGINAVVFATEAGIGTAAIVYGGSESKEPIADSIGSMLGVFISTTVCFLVAMCIIASGVWNSGLTSTALTVAAYNSTFSWFGGWLVTFLSTTFGMGVLVTYAYITRAVWLYLTGGKGQRIFTVLYCLFAFMGALLKVDMLWKLTDITNVLLLIVNLFGIVMLLPLIVRGIAAYHSEKR
ncbi:sodium:alanine symporter family protein [Candidatus Dependentiae bacterium]|nr:sodium:alanine symporter family protein [Candidatus Dependentiae bacterium]